jgi:peptidoglycan/LPS O-acetylase OafA/YrhL
MKTEQRLDQLTSLRFFAALMIVFHHSGGLLGVAPVNLGPGVSFFFVLSGFILAYVYPRLSKAETPRFWLARFARIWPAYALSFLLALALLPLQWDTMTAASHLAMVQAWLPMSLFYFSYNAVAWSVSTEVFFYLLFPLLIQSWQRTWMVKLGLAAALVVAMIWIGAGMPEYGDPLKGEGLKVTMHGLVYINPLARLLEFVVGMALAQFCSKAKPGIVWTLLEMLTIGVCAWSMFYSPRVAHLAGEALGYSARMWVSQCGSVFAFAALVYVMARGGGAVSRLLQWRPLVVLGEISFTMYLLHQTLFYLWHANASKLSAVPAPIAVAVFFAVLLGSSYAIWRTVETPARRAILSIGRPAAQSAVVLSGRVS